MNRSYFNLFLSECCGRSYEFVFLTSRKSGLSKTPALAFLLSIFSLSSIAATTHDNSIRDVARVVQESSKAMLTRNQYGKYSSSSVIEQIGVNNIASSTQFNNNGSYSLSYVIQNGSNNRADVSQQGGGNIGFVFQFGDDHIANIEQKGNSGRFLIQASVSQYGFNSDITVSQSKSDGRSISVEQRSYSGMTRPITIETY